MDNNKDFDKVIPDNKNSQDIESTKNISIPNKQEISDIQKEMNTMRKKQKSKANTYLFRTVWIIMVVFISILFTKYILVGINDMLAIDREESTVTIEIPANPNAYTVARVLSDSHVIKNESFFRVYSFLTRSNKKFTQGEFEVKTNMDYEEIINYIQSQVNRIDVINIMFPEGYNVLQYADLLESNGVCNAKDFLNACNSNDFDDEYSFIKEISNADQRYYKLEGYLFPDTYKFYKGEDPKYTIERFLNNYEDKIIQKKKVEGYDSKISIEDQAKEAGMSMNDLLTLASVIQAEAANEEDMYKVSSVLHNRLKTVGNDGMNKYLESGLNKLSCDSTIWYPYKSKDELPQDIKNTFKSRYNTYSIIGLPPGAICNPGLTAIDAALHPKDTDYYYFCHSSEKVAYYASTINEHNTNLVKAGLR